MTKAELRRIYVLWAREKIEVSELFDALGKFVGEPPRCPMCHGKGTVNFELASGWDEPCPECTSP